MDLPGPSGKRRALLGASVEFQATDGDRRQAGGIETVSQGLEEMSESSEQLLHRLFDQYSRGFSQLEQKHDTINARIVDMNTSIKLQEQSADQRARALREMKDEFREMKGEFSTALEGMKTENKKAFDEVLNRINENESVNATYRERTDTMNKMFWAAITAGALGFMMGLFNILQGSA